MSTEKRKISPGEFASWMAGLGAFFITIWVSRKAENGNVLAKWIFEFNVEFARQIEQWTDSSILGSRFTDIFLRALLWGEIAIILSPFTWKLSLWMNRYTLKQTEKVARTLHDPEQRPMPREATTSDLTKRFGKK